MFRFLFFLFLLLPLKNFAQDITLLLREAGQSETAFREEDALHAWQQILKIQPNNVTALCKCSDFSCRIGNRQASKTEKATWFNAGRAYADAAYRLDPHNSEVDIVMAFSTARIALISGSREKVAAAGDVKKYAENAIKENPRNFKGYHILGRWNYEISGLNIIEKTLVKWFYGALPDGSLQQSIRYYEKSMALAPDFMLNYLELAKACHRDGQQARAITLLRHLDVLHDQMFDDSRVRQEARKLLADWQ